MKPAPFVLLLAAAVLVAWIAPGDDDAPAGPSAPSAASSEAPFESGPVILPRADDGHFYAEVTVDGAAATMLIDTGASVIALTGADAERLGVAWEPEAVGPIGRGASGPVHGVAVTLGAVRVGDIEAENVAAVVIPDGLAVSLLGQSFLGRIGRVEMTGDEMALGG